MRHLTVYFTNLTSQIGTVAAIVVNHANQTVLVVAGKKNTTERSVVEQFTTVWPFIKYGHVGMCSVAYAS